MCYCTVCFCNTVYKYNALYVNCMQCVLWAVQFQYIVGQLFFHCSVFFLWSTVYIVHCPSATLFCNPIILCTMLCILFCVHLNNVKCTSTMYIYIYIVVHHNASLLQISGLTWPVHCALFCAMLCIRIHHQRSTQSLDLLKSLCTVNFAHCVQFSAWGCNQVLLSSSVAGYIAFFCAHCVHCTLYTLYIVQFWVWGCNEILLQ